MELGYRKFDTGGSASAHLAAERDGAAVSIHNSLDHQHADAEAMAFGGQTGFKHRIEAIFGNTVTGIRN